MSSERPSVAFIVGEFPKPSETFILRELTELARRKLDFVIVATGRLPDISEADALSDRVILRPPYFSPRSLAGEVRFMLTHPLRYFDVIFKLMGAHWRKLGELLQVLANLPRAMALGYALRRRGVKRVHAMWASFPATLGWMMARGLGMTCSFSAHARDVHVEGRMLREKLRRADRAFVCNRSAAEQLAEIAGTRNARKIVLVHHGLDLDSLPKRAETPEKRILAAGRFERKKGFDVLIEACRQLMRRGREVPLTLVGDGPLKATLARASSDLPVTISPWMTHDDLMHEIASAGVVAVPSVIASDGDRDGIPNILVEAMAIGTPVVGSDVGGIGEVIHDGETGRLVAPGEVEALAGAIAKMLDDESAAARMASRASELVRREFRIEDTVTTLQTLFAE